MKTIPMNEGFEAVVDDADFYDLMQFKWYVNKNKNRLRAYRSFRVAGKNRKEAMHRRIMQPPITMDIDHINHDGLDNRRCNLRICTRSENMMNQFGHTSDTKTSKYKGVNWDKSRSKWRAQIRFGKHQRHVGYYDSEMDAAVAYDFVAKNYFGDFAFTNIRALMPEGKP